ncbi:transcription factor HIVEP3 [Lucilia sericata]|uniref:transcription factor HIVEP3 n=1 Tax=Lucilia sericata TaxID=13632 RepID=UPI0018A84F1F|nr:transcription factor HIVEP3 [Lucilia sericata]XP_037822371.1 transcription factor HIVEP3 [Lucilia sericata]XP_037822372.1 transcription factor HIVEP3 [Lucilia sericata]
MEATTTTANTKYYNKTIKQNNNNNNHQQNKTTTITNNKKTQQTTYRGETNETQTQMVETTPATTQKKLTAKQAKAAAKLAAQQQQQQNAKSDTNKQQQQQQQQQQNEAAKKMITETKEAKSNVTNIPATTTTTATTKSNTTAINANNTTTAAATTANNISNSSSNSNRNNNNNNNSSNMNTSDNSMNSSIKEQQQQQQQQQQENSTKSDNQTADNTASTMSWNNSKYLHKKFKRLASTTENDALQEAEKLRTTSMSSASSSVSSPPPPPLQIPTQQAATATIPATTIKNEEHLTNGVLTKKETQHQTENLPQQQDNYSQNQVLLQLAQQQQQQNVIVVSTNSTEISSNNTQSVSTATVTTTSTTTGSSTAGGGGRYKCPYCDLSCTKPSVLQKHIRAHTNERPYPCEICGIAFKTKSNLYKHCRSRSHAARQKGIEVSPDADDGLSDQDVDPELSNSSSEMLSRTDSPIEELTNNTMAQQPFMQTTEPQVSIAASTESVNITSIAPASSFTSVKPSFLQQPAQQQSQRLPLGSPAAGTLPPAAAQTSMGANNTAASSNPKQAIDYKPYKPKFHNASLYSTAKEAAAAAAAVNTSTMSTTGLPMAAHSTPVPQKDVAPMQKLPESPHPHINQHQHLVVPASEQNIVVPSSSSVIHLPPPPQQSPTHMAPSHHPSLSPSTQMKLNNHISTHQLQQLQQQQLQQLQSHTPPHHLLGPPPTANALPLPLAAAAYYLGQPPGSPAAALLHPSPHLPAQSFYNPVYASLHMMTPQQQQQFHHQLQIQQQHLQQQQQLQLTHSSLAAVIPTPSPTQSSHSQTSPSIPQSLHKPPTPLSNTNHAMSANNSRSIHHPKANTPTGNSTLVNPTQQNALHYLANAASAASVAMSPPNPVNNKNTVEIMDQGTSAISQRTPAHVSNSSNSSTLLQTNANSGMQEVTLDKEKLNEHINKLISQNTAIVENKELLLQKKYPKTLNRSRSFTNNNSSSSSSTNTNATGQVLQSTTGAPPSESPTNAKLAQAIVQKQQMQQQQQQQQQLQQQYMYQQQQQQHQQQLQKQRHLYHDKPNMDELSPAPLPLNGTSKHLVGKQMVQPQPIHPAQQMIPSSLSNQTQFQQYRTIVTITPTQPRQTANSAATSLSSNTSSVSHNSLANVPLNLSAKTKLPEESLDLNKPGHGPLPQAPPPATPRKRHSIEQTQAQGQSQLLTPSLVLNEASNSSNSNSSTPQPSTSAGKNPHNNSIIKHLLLNARGLAVPTGTGEDAVYVCPLCSFGFRTAEELKLHNSTYCQGSNSSANSPASSPSHKYFRSNSMSLNPLSLAKLAWSQLKTKPSNLVLNRLSASVANTSKNSSTHTTSATSTQPSSQSTANNTSSTAGSSILSVASQPNKTQPANNELPIRFVDAPLPSPGPLLGKTPLVDYTLNESKSKSEEVIITKMHDDPMYSHINMAEHPATKRLKFEASDKFSSKRSSLTSGGEMQLLTAQELSKKEERYKRFTSSGGCMIPLSECDDVDKSPKMIRTPLLSGGSFQEVSPKKEQKMPLPLMPGTQLTPKLSLGLSSSNGPQHFQFPPINQITAFNPLTLGLTEKVIPYVPGIPGPNSLQPQLPLAPPTASQQQKQQQHLLNLPQTTNSKNLSRNNSPNRNQTPSPMNMSTTMQQGGSPDSSGLNKPTFGGVQNVPSEFNRAPPTTNMRNVRNWPAAVNNSTFNNNSTGHNSKTTAAVNDVAKPLKSFNFMRMADNLSPRKSENKTTTNSSNLTEAETRHFNLDKMSREQLIIQQPLTSSSKSLSPTNLTLTPLHVDTNVTTTLADSDATSAEVKAKSKFLRPTSLPLRPGTFTPKRHHGITPTANTLPLISPETPRPSKECVQLYLNGNSYTYLGLKCSTKTFYCTLNCPQPSYVQDMHKLSMYSMWQQCAENNPHPLGLKPKEVMSLYDSRQKTIIFTMAKGKKITYTFVAAQQTVMTPFISSRDKFEHHQLKQIALKDSTHTKDSKTSSENKESSKDNSGASTSNSAAVSQTLEGGYESHENYIYVRGRGRGKYVCSECGIRCKKPSMLKKHIRTHTDVRPYTCKHCNFSFKTKGNLTKHMQSKTHYKKCIELGLNPGPMPAEGDFLEPDVEFDQQSSTSAGGRTSSMGNGESDSEGDSSDNETESSNESDSAKSNVTPQLNVSAAEDNKSHLEHEAARCLLTLSMTPPIHTPSLETSMANSQMTTVTTVSSSCAISSTPSQAIRRVISYTSPKPPFDYQKQEQYYSNPKEHKPKLNNSSATSFETAPMDLTKPRNMEVISSSSITHTPTSFSSNPGPVQTQAQIRDVIFGVNKNESGFLKTMISVSSKVGRNYADNYEENHHKLNEDMMLYDYRREQTLQYYKIKQTQLSRGMTVNPNVMMSNATPTSSPAITTSVSLGSTMVSTSSEAVIVTSMASSAPTTASEQIVAKKEVIAPLQLPKIEIVEPQETLKAETTVPVTVPAVMPVLAPATTTEAPKSLKSSDESEETDEEPPAKKVATKTNDDKPAHNANLPAAILQPGTTDFSGVLSGGGSSSQANQPQRTVIVGEDGFTTNNNEILPVHPRVPQISNADGRPVCSICSKTFQKQSQLVLHMNIHYMERKYKCDPCGVSFRTQGHLQKHERSEAHKNKVIMTSTFGVPTTSNPRPFECTDCKIAFRIHGHLAKHLRSKTHVQKLECLQKLPFGTYAEIERAGISLTEIDTSDCENSLISLRVLAQKLIEKDPTSKLGSYTTPSGDNSNTGLVSQDSASEDGFTAAERAAATAIASLDNNSAANTPRRANSTSEDESIAMALNNNLKRRLPGTFSNGEESDKEFQEQQEKRLRPEGLINNTHLNTASPTN